MNIGKMDRPVTLQAPSVVAQNNYGEEAPQTYTDVETVHAERKPGTGVEVQQAEQLTAVQQVTYQIRYRTDVQTTWQLIDRGVTYQITAITEIGRRHSLTLTCFARG